MTLYHHSHQAIYREPFGAVPTGTPVTLRLDSSFADVTNVYFCWHMDGQEEQRIEMELQHHSNGYARFIVTFQAPQHSGLIWYYFAVEHGGEVTFYGNNEQGNGGMGIESSDPPPCYQITIYGDKYLPPAWFRGKVMYQIFVDRFYNGNENGMVNHPKNNSLLHSHWDNDPVYVRGEQGEISNWDFFGGNLLGIQKKLAYLSDLGVDIIYLNPIFQAPSNHKYDTGDYHQIDEMFGDENTFRELCEKATDLDITIILDGVFSHTGSDSKYFNKDGNYQSLGAYQSTESPFYNWYRFHSHPDEYEAWWGIDTMPNVNELNRSYLEFLIEADDSVLHHWQQFGIKGWRLDVADELPDEFIKKFKHQLRQHDPDSVLIGEVWEDASHKISYEKRRSYLLGEELDSVTNYVFRDTVIAFMVGDIGAEQVHFQLTSLYENYPKAHFYCLMNIVGTHDTARIFSEMRKKVPENVADYPITLKRTKLVSLWQILFPGVPCIYYGDEAGLTGGEEPLNRRTYPWGKENNELLEWYKKLLAIRKNHEVFQKGKWSSFWFGEDVYGFVLKMESSSAIVLLNRSSEDKVVELKDHKGPFVDLINDKKVNGQNNIVNVRIQALKAVVLIENRDCHCTKFVE